MNNNDHNIPLRKTYPSTTSSSTSCLNVAKDITNDEVVVQWEDEDNEEDEQDEDDDDGSRLPLTSEVSANGIKTKKIPRWENLNPTIKEKLRQKGQQRAIANKKKVESAQSKKRRLMMYVKEQTQKKKLNSKVQRPIPFNDRNLTLTDLKVGQELTGTVISLTNFGAYVDVGTECDGLLHISQLSRQIFVEHPRQLLSPGDELTNIRVRSVNPEKHKLHLTLLDSNIIQQELQQQNEIDQSDRITLDELQIDDELWGEIKRVTDYGAYVEVGTIVDGWIHFMDHPSWIVGSHPSEFMTCGDRIRVWVADIDQQQQRLKLTANRPNNLPGPRRELIGY